MSDKKITIAVIPTRSLLEKLAHHWGYTLEETAEVYAVLVQHSAVPPSKSLTASPQAHLLGRILRHLEGSDPNNTSGGIRNAHLREEIRVAMSDASVKEGR